MLPKMSNYGQYSSGNYGAHSLKVETENITLYYSYDTIVAFRSPETGLVVSKNVWGTTTGKHLNWIDDNKDIRLSRAEFIQKLNEAIKKHIV